MQEEFETLINVEALLGDFINSIPFILSLFFKADYYRIYSSLILSLFFFNTIALFFVVFFFPVPPNIDDSLSSGDVIVREGNNITLSCHAFGFPMPTIKWRRDDGSNITLNKTHVGKYTKTN